MGGELERPAGWDRDAVNRMLRYHGEIAHALTVQRTALESALIPVTAYILISGVECYRRHPELMTEIAAAVAPEELGARGRSLGNQIDTVHLWSIANIYLVGRSVLAGGGLIDFEADVTRTASRVRLLEARRGRVPRRRHAAGRRRGRDGHAVRRLRRRVRRRLRTGARRRAARAAVATRTRCSRRTSSCSTSTRAPVTRTPVRTVLPDGRVLLLRAFNRFGPSDFSWSHAVAADLPYSTVVAAFVLEGVDLHVTDFGTSVTEPADYLDRLVAFGLFDPFRAARPVPIAEADALALGDAVKAAQRQLYRLIAGMTRHEKLDAGAYVYFSFLRPFAEAAGIADRLDWTVPRDSLDLYPLLELFESTPEITSDAALYYPPIP